MDEVRRRRRRIRLAWRARREETKRVRSRVLYQLMDFVGAAPRLQTDTIEVRGCRRARAHPSLLHASRTWID